MARDFVLPDLGEGLTEAEIRQVLVREGEVVREDAPLLEVETDKATVEIPSPFGGRVDRIHVHPGQTVKVGQVLVSFGEGDAPSGTQVADTLDATREPAPGPKTGVAESGRARQTPPAPAEPTAGRRDGPVPAAPSTRRLARELGVDLRAVNGSGPGGRVTDDDVRAASAGTSTGGATSRAAAKPAPRAASSEPLVAKPLTRVATEPPLPRFEQWGPIERQPLSHLRRTIAERMTLSATVIPHVTHFDRADITNLDALIRRNLEAGQARGVTLTLTSFLLKATALALGEGGELAGHGEQGLFVHVADDRHDEAALRRHRDAEMMVALEDQLAGCGVEARVELRVRGEGDRRRLQEEAGERERDAARAGRLEIVPDERVEIGDVGAVEVGHVGNDRCR